MRPCDFQFSSIKQTNIYITDSIKHNNLKSEGIDKNICLYFINEISKI